MSCVLSRFYKNKTRNTEIEMKAYGLDDKFYMLVTRYNPYEGTQSSCVEITPSQAKELRDQLSEFIEQN